MSFYADTWGDRTRRDRERLQRLLEPKCLELLGNAEAALNGALASIPWLADVAALGTGSAPSDQNTVGRLVAFTARTTDGKASLEIIASVESYIDTDHLAFRRKPLRIFGRWRDFHVARDVKSTFKRIRGPRTMTSYELDEHALREALAAVVSEAGQR